jgi:hypothetical protein
MIIGGSGRPRRVSGLRPLDGTKLDYKSLQRDVGEIGYIADTKDRKGQHTRRRGAWGTGSSVPAGVAAARNNRKVMLIDGDDSLYQHIQELETLRRHGIKLLICIINDGGYGAETHKFRALARDLRDRRAHGAAAAPRRHLHRRPTLEEF